FAGHIFTDSLANLSLRISLSLLYLPFAIANALTARLNDGVPLVDERLVLLLYCVFSGPLLSSASGKTYLDICCCCFHLGKYYAIALPN
ncbi:choline/ethanolaminephosphotransferase 1, partial [Fagus crenata]